MFKYEKNFENYIKTNNILKFKNIQLLPMKFNLKNFYSRIDVILFPGYMNAVGRPVIEASLLKKPAIIALKNYNNDTAMKNNCLTFKPGDIISLEKKILHLIKNKSRMKERNHENLKNSKQEDGKKEDLDQKVT